MRDESRKLGPHLGLVRKRFSERGMWRNWSVAAGERWATVLNLARIDVVDAEAVL